MKEKNPCLISGCHGYCCKNIVLEMTDHEIKRLFPNAIKVNSLKESNEKPKDIPNIYFRSIRRKKFSCNGINEVTIIGNCPHLDKKGNCNEHAERSHAARNFIIGSKLCNEIRQMHNLPIMIPKEPVE